jgi:AmmeMemoRadiSam system protein A
MTAPAADMLSWPSFARRVIESVARGVDPAQIDAPPLEPRTHGGVFVTLHERGRLRGCMGILDSQTPLPEAVRQAAACASSQDPRFSPVRPEDLAALRVEVSILTSPQPMRDLADLELGRHGVLVRRGGRRGLFLPQVAVEHRLDKETFLSRCCDEKAGLPANAWQDPATEVLLFTTEVFQET